MMLRRRARPTFVINTIANLLQSSIDNKSHSTGKFLHARILRLGLTSDTFLSNRLFELYTKCSNTTYASHLFEKMSPKKNVYSWNAMLSHYCKVCDLESVYELFDRMPERNEVSWNNLISTLVRSGFEREALDAYGEMVVDGFVPTRFTLTSVLSACGALSDCGFGRKFHCVAIKVGLEKNVFVGSALLSFYARCGFVSEALRVFEATVEKNEVSFTAIMDGLAQTDRVVEALEMFRFMCRRGIRVDSVSLSSVLGVCARSGYGESSFCHEGDGILCNLHGIQVHGLVIKLGFEGDLHLSNSLLDMYAKNGDMDSTEKVFAGLPVLTVTSWNIIIAGYGQIYEAEKAIGCMERMQSLGFEPDEVTFINMLAACLKSGDMKTARRMFDNMAFPSVSSCNALLSGYSQNGNYEEVMKLFREMQIRNIQPDRTTLAIVLSSCACMGLLKAGKEVHAAVQKACFYNDLYAGSGLINVYSKCGRMDMAQRVFERMPELDIVCWNSMLSGFSLNALGKEAFAFYKQMRRNGVFPTEFSYATLLSCCTKLSTSVLGRQVHAQMSKEGYTDDVFVGSALIDMYCKCGDVDDAQKFFDLMPSRNTFTWNEMIHGYAQSGHGDKAVQLYKSMVDSGEKPDSITFTAILTACSHSGLVHTGLQIFDSMQQDHSVEPMLEHYTCIIDALGRAGRFQEAEKLVGEMPCKDDPIVWEVLLSACRVHSNVTLAKQAAEKLLCLDPRNSSPYVLLANMYTSLGRWEEAREVRDRMCERQIVKNAGCSWMDLEISALWVIP